MQSRTKLWKGLVQHRGMPGQNGQGYKMVQTGMSTGKGPGHRLALLACYPLVDLFTHAALQAAPDPQQHSRAL